MSLGLALLVVPLLDASSDTILLFEFVVVGGLLLFWVGHRFFSLHLRIWQIVLIVFGLGVGLWFGGQPVRYHEICCEFAYTVGQGYPFIVLKHGMVMDTLLSQGQADAFMQDHPNQVWWDVDWWNILANGVFYAYASFITVIGLGGLVSLFTRSRARSKAPSLINH
jgi:hypothetical protein